jgi:ribosomal protein S18 acetylase RimI-like enzyme
MQEPASSIVPASLRILINPYADVSHARAIFEMLDSYARDPMGGGKALGPGVRRDLVPELRRRPWIVTLLALEGETPVGLLIAMEGFSTFAARPLLNIHDVAVHPDHRGRGVGTALFQEAEKIALKRGCCKLTLEVLSGNEGAKRLYQRLGFKPYVLDPETGVAQFWDKAIQN